jgi:hypothetical protein
MLAWDRSHSWVVQRYYNDRSRVKIRFEKGLPSVTELIAIRKLLPKFRDIAPASLRSLIGASGELCLEEMMSMTEVRRLVEVARRQGLVAVAEDASFVSYLPFDQTTNCAWLIENDAEALAVAKAMIAEGVPVQDVYACG